MKAEALFNGLEYEILCGNTDIDVHQIYNDSRKVEAGGLFFCICGANSDGHSYIRNVIEKGAVCVVVEKDVEPVKDVLIIKVSSTRTAMGIVSSNFYGNPSDKLTVIGITGTKGKTTTTYMIREMLMSAGHKTGLVGTIEILDGVRCISANNTTPESIIIHKTLKDMVDNGLDSVVMEVSSQGLMLDRIAGVKFDYGIFSNLSKDHIGPNEHSSFEEYAMWKSRLFTLCKTGIFNGDDANVDTMTEHATCSIIKYGMNGDYEYKAGGHELYQKDGHMGITYELSGLQQGRISVNLPGNFSIYNSLAAIAVADQMGVPFDRIKNILTDIKVKGRVELIPISDQFTIMIDYAHNAMSLSSILMTLREYNPKRLVCLFGCGGNRSKDRRYEMGEVSGNMADLTIITSDNPRNEEPQAIIDDIKIGISKTDGKYIEIIDRKEAIRYAIMNAEKGDVIILAGKGHEDYQDICGVKYHMDERDLIREVLEEEDVEKICGYNNRYFA
ncbi:MAG: UDP-N-acetylmuramoyl-L-alanyl-D-glutamate--2,6-diaminopimelate ligase [Coprococcus sp.]|nr:UDP-N-acetylmuramoyl-L-alanyl-D-glutamate--2,6-diaminopimelate ligase [Coprococcus sp.]